MSIWNIHGWENLTVGKPEVVAAREKILRQLDRVPEPHRAKWEKRLKSRRDDSHFSVRLELFLHGFFKERGWGIEIEPALSGTPNSPDFYLHRDGNEILAEAKTLLDSREVEQQYTRLKTLADELTKKLNRTVLIHPYFDLPPSLPNRHIASEIEKRASAIGLFQEFRIAGEHQGQPYELEVTILSDHKLTPNQGVGAMVGQVHEANTGQRMREEIINKASKYGEMNTPFVVAVWPQTNLYIPGPSEDDLVALRGDEVWILSPLGDGSTSFEPNGVFTLKNSDGTHRFSRVSAVAIYQFKYDVDPPHTGCSTLRVYHNPWAEHTLDIDVFQGIPQGIVNPDTGMMEWT